MDETLIDGDVRPLAQSGHRLEIGPPASDARVTGGGEGEGAKKKSQMTKRSSRGPKARARVGVTRQSGSSRRARVRAARLAGTWSLFFSFLLEKRSLRQFPGRGADSLFLTAGVGKTRAAAHGAEKQRRIIVPETAGLRDSRR